MTCPPSVGADLLQEPVNILYAVRASCTLHAPSRTFEDASLEAIMEAPLSVDEHDELTRRLALVWTVRLAAIASFDAWPAWTK